MMNSTTNAMTENFIISLCYVRTKDVNIEITASMEYGCLRFTERDGNNVFLLKGKSYRYIYRYELDEANTAKLLKCIGGTLNPQRALSNIFSGVSGCLHLVEFCKENGIDLTYVRQV